MKRNRKQTLMLMFVTTLCMGAAGAAYAADDEGMLSGSINLGVRGVDDQNKRSAKFWEYRDMNDGTFGNAAISAELKNYYLDLYATNPGLDDQSYRINGGNYGNFKYSLWYNETPHNYTFGAKSFYSGIGTRLLDYGYANNPVVGATYTPTVPTNATLWNDFDYGIKRKDWGGSAELSFKMPVYFKAEVSRTKVKGTQPIGAPSGVDATFSGAHFTAFGNAVELPAPVSYVTNNIYLETGYKSQNFTASLDGTISTFSNDNEYLTWRNPYVTNQSLYETSSLAPENDYWKVGGQFKLNLPLNSVLSARGSYAKLENSFDVRNSLWASNHPYFGDSTYTYTTLPVSKLRFEGDISYKSASVAINSSPIKPLDLKAYYNFLKKTNDSTQVTYAGTATNELFGYTKNNAGFDIGYRLPGKNKIDAGYEFFNIYRPEERDDAKHTTDHKFYVQYKNSTLEMLTAKLRYQYLTRSADFENDTLATTDINRYIRRFDATDKKQHAIKSSFDFEPIEHLGIGFEYAYKLDDYDKTIIGLTKARRHEFYTDISYEIPAVARLTGFFDYETSKNQSTSRNFATNGDPTAAADPANYNWNSTTKDESWAYGVGVEVPVIKDRLTVIASWTHQRSDGTNDLTSQNNYGSPVSFGSYDNAEKKNIDLKTVYNFTKNLDVTAGYGYEMYSYSDPAYNGYTYISNNAAAFSNSYLTGAYANPNYEAHIGYISMGYKF